MSEGWCVLQFFGHWMGLVVDVLPPGRCYACILADVNQLLFVVLHIADVVANQFVADVIATVMYFIGRCYCLLLVG